MRERTSRIAFVAGCALVLASSPGLATSIFQGLGDLPGGAYDSRAIGVSGDGSVVVGWSQTGSAREAFRWTRDGGMVGLGVLPGGIGSEATSASYDGSVIVGRSRVSDGFNAIRWTQAGGMESIGDLPGGKTDAMAHDVSADGSVVVGSGTQSSTGAVDAFIWTRSSGMQRIETPPNTAAGTATAVSADGRIVVGKVGANPGTQATRWTAETGTVLLGDLPTDAPPPGTTANGISADGRVVVGQSSGNGPFSWTEEDGMLFLGNPDGTADGAANDASADGSIIVGVTFRNTSELEATIWDAQHGMRLLEDVLTRDFGINLGGWQLLSAVAISDDGHVITGVGINPSGDREGWVFVANPEPSTGSLLALGLFALAARSRRRRRGRAESAGR